MKKFVALVYWAGDNWNRQRLSIERSDARDHINYLESYDHQKIWVIPGFDPVTKKGLQIFRRSMIGWVRDENCENACRSMAGDWVEAATNAITLIEQSDRIQKTMREEFENLWRTTILDAQSFRTPIIGNFENPCREVEPINVQFFVKMTPGDRK